MTASAEQLSVTIPGMAFDECGKQLARKVALPEPDVAVVGGGKKRVVYHGVTRQQVEQLAAFLISEGERRLPAAKDGYAKSRARQLIRAGRQLGTGRSTMDQARAEEREAKRQARQQAKLQKGAERKRRHVQSTGLATIIAQELARERARSCRCAITPQTTVDELRALGSGCTAGRWVCPTLDAIRRRMTRSRGTGGDEAT